VICRIFALCCITRTLRRLGACRIFAESLRRLVGRFRAKVHWENVSQLIVSWFTSLEQGKKSSRATGPDC